jgi:hypothetical protein
MNRHPHILNAASNLLAVCFIIIGGLKFSKLETRTFSDEIAWAAAFLLFLSVLHSYLAIRNNDAKHWQSTIADWSFISGLVALMLAVLTAAVDL